MPSPYDNAVWSPLPGSQTFFLTCPVWEVLYEGTRGSGKALRNDTPIATPEGWTDIGKLRVGDAIFGADGQLTTVVGVYPQGKCNEWAVDFEEADTLYCDADHLWIMPTGSWREGRDRMGMDYSGWTKECKPLRTQQWAMFNGTHRELDLSLCIPTMDAGSAHIAKDIRPTGRTSEMTCIAVDAEDRMFLAGKDLVATHNTDALLMDYLRDVGKGYGSHWNGVLFRRTFKELDDVVKKSKQWFPRLHPDAKFHASPVSYKWVFRGGETLAFRHAKKPSDYNEFHGHEIPWMGFEELTTWPSLDLYHQLKSVSRTSIKGIPLRIRATTNPYGPGHNIVKSYFIDPAPARQLIKDGETGLYRMRVAGHWSENIYLLAGDPDYPQKIAQSASNEAQKKAWLDGSWDITAGGMFDDLWDSGIHVFPPFAIPKDWRIDRAFDWGDSKPFSVGWWAQSDGTPTEDGLVLPRGSIVRIAEWYGWDGTPNRGLRLTDQSIANGILDRELRMGIHKRCKKGPADNMIFYSKPGEPSTSEIMRKCRVPFVRADKKKDSRKRGWTAIRRMLEAARKKRPEDPGLWVFNHCRQFLRTVPSIPRDDKDMDDVDTEVEDHIADETRYRVLTPQKGSVRSFGFSI